jgi:hypothetical protein
MLIPKARSVFRRMKARSSRSASAVRALSDGMQPRMPASAAATIISLLERMNIGAATSGYSRPSFEASGVVHFIADDRICARSSQRNQ